VELANHLVPPRGLGNPRSVVDVGCGLRPQRLTIPTERYLGIDVHQTYIDALVSVPGREFICAGWKDGLGALEDGEFDVLTALDFIEHLEREDGFAFLEEAQRVARLVVIFTPLGPFPQEHSFPDQWGMDGGVPQTHRSAWLPEDFPGWETYRWAEMHTVDGHMNPLPEPIGAFWALREEHKDDG